MVFENGTNNRLRIINNAFYKDWQSTSDESIAADEIIEAPESHLLTQQDLYAAEGGHAGLTVQMLGLLLGVGSVFASSKRMGTYWGHGGLIW